MDEVIEKEKVGLKKLEKTMKSRIKHHFAQAKKNVRIKELGKVVTGSTPPTDNIKYWNCGTIPFVTLSEVDNSIYVNNTERYLTRLGVEKSRLIPAKSVLTVCIGSTIGKVVIKEFESCSNQQINAIILNDEYSPFYILHLLRFHKSKILARIDATAEPIINKTEFESIKLPILEQNEIAVFEMEITAFSRSSEFTNEKITTSRALQKSLINQIF